jgi:hypothetical protein
MEFGISTGFRRNLLSFDWIFTRGLSGSNGISTGFPCGISSGLYGIYRGPTDGMHLKTIVESFQEPKRNRGKTQSCWSKNRGKVDKSH